MLRYKQEKKVIPIAEVNKAFIKSNVLKRAKSSSWQWIAKNTNKQDKKSETLNKLLPSHFLCLEFPKPRDFCLESAVEIK